MATEYTTLSVLLFTEGPDGWQSVTGPLNGVHVAPSAETAVTIIAMFDSWLAANAGADNAQFHWRLFEFCIIAGDKTRAVTALETAVAKGRNLSAEVLAESQAKLV